MQRFFYCILLPSFILALLLIPHGQADGAKDTQWHSVPVPEIWRKPPRGKLTSKDGFAWYRAWVKVPKSWDDKDLSLYVEPVDDARAVYFNGTQIGAAGTFPPRYRSGLNEKSQHRVPKSIVNVGDWNLVALRVYFEDGRTNFNVAAPVLLQGKEAIRLEGNWQARPGDDPKNALTLKAKSNAYQFSKVDLVKDVELYVRRRKGDHDPYPPKEALKTFKVPTDLKLELVLSEPEIGQPLFFNFDERGRLWVLQYKQYPNPAGLKVLSRDKYLRAVYDKVPPPPPNHFKGQDKITIHADTDNDGIMDKHTTFVDGLNIASSFVRGRGGVWVLNPPYLLFYPDKNNDDKPDGPPIVHLEGFGMEDSHSVANSLRLGPDGWLYAAQGSTVTGQIKRPKLDKEATHSMGQLIWRYHPETRQYEIFAEGGGNTFGVEIDSKGRIYSGHNGGDTRGFHYVQGGYYRKGFNKHGSLSNPYAFGYFPSMSHHKVPRFTHNFIIYEGDSLPEQYHGQLFGIEPLQGQIVQSDVKELGSTFKTRDLSRIVQTGDQWFRPVDIKAGPEGGIYFADFYEQRIDHSSHYAGRVDKESGRIYRLVNPNRKRRKPFDYGQLNSEELASSILKVANKWDRQTALRLLADRKDRSIIPLLKKQIATHTDQLALESLWALNVSGGLTESVGAELLKHKNPYVRLWTVRLLCDDGKVTPSFAAKLRDLAENESHVEVRSQLACSARRLSAPHCLAIVRQLLTFDQDLADPHVPLLLWWAIENKAEESLSLFSDSKVWKLPIVEQQILERLMRRFAQAGSRKDLLTCAKLLELAPSQEHARILIKGFELAYQGRTLPLLPAALVQAMAKSGGASLALQLRQGNKEAIGRALTIVENPKSKRDDRLQLIRIFGQISAKDSVPVLLKLINSTKDETIRQSALTALQGQSESRIGKQVLSSLNRMPSDSKKIALNLLASRKVWAEQLLDAISAGPVQKASVPTSVVRKILLHNDKTLAQKVKKHFGDIQGATTEQMRKEIERLTKVISIGSGNPYQGRTLYGMHCAKCHTLFGQGGAIGPDLTSFQRTDLPRILLNVVNPSAEIREGFENYLIETDDGQVHTGFLIEEDNRVVVIRDAEGQNHVVPKSSIDDKRALNQSIMPEGLLKDLTAQQIRDLFAYLRSSQPLP